MEPESLEDMAARFDAQCVKSGLPPPHQGYTDIGRIRRVWHHSHTRMVDVQINGGRIWWKCEALPFGSWSQGFTPWFNELPGVLVACIKEICEVNDGQED